MPRAVRRADAGPFPLLAHVLAPRRAAGDVGELHVAPGAGELVDRVALRGDRNDGRCPLDLRSGGAIVKPFLPVRLGFESIPDGKPGFDSPIALFAYTVAEHALPCIQPV